MGGGLVVMGAGFSRRRRSGPPGCSCCGRVPGWLRALFLTTMLGAVLGALAPLAAQQADTVPPDTVLTPEERVLERLRGLRPATGGVARPEDTLPVPDTLRPREGRTGRPSRQPRSSITPDSVMRELLRLEGYEALSYTADSVRFSAEGGEVNLLGTSELERDGQGMRADSLLVYDLDAERVCGFGSPVFTGRDIQPVTSERVCYDVRRQLGVAIGGRTTFQQGAEWRVEGRELYQAGESRTFVDHARFTSCDLEEPHYHFAARKVKLVRDSVMVARDITLNFGDVPVFWMPFMVQSLRTGRRSGLLTPSFSVNHVVRTGGSLNRRIDNVGFFWAINDYMGAQLSLGWFANNYTSLNGIFEYRMRERFLEGAVETKQFWRDAGGTELTLASRNAWQPDERTRLQLNATYASSTDFVARNTFDPRELSRDMESNVAASRRFGWGSVDVSGIRRQSLSDNRVNLTLPRVGLNLSPITLFEAPPTQASWYNNATLNASGGFTANRQDIDEALSRRDQDQRRREGNLNSTLRMGNFSLRQTVRLDRQESFAREVTPTEQDTLTRLDGKLAEALTWESGLDYQVRLIGTSTLTPRVAVRGERLRSDETGFDFVAAPTRLDFGAALQTDIFGFYPGLGPLERVRHRLSPNVRYDYSPAPTISERQDSIFGRSLENLRERNRITVGLNQTIEAKYRQETPADTAADQAEEAEQDQEGRGEEEGPRRRQDAPKVTILSLQTDAIGYDFVRARDGGHGITSEELRNSLSSDLLRGLRVSVTHDLFEEGERTEDGEVPRDFAPHLQRLNASFSFGSDAWLFRVLGLAPGRGGAPEEEPGVTLGERRESDEPAGDLGTEEESELDRPMARREGTIGMIGGRGQINSGPVGGPVGSWNASLNYNWARPRPAELERGREESQLINATITFQPTPLWSVNWRTGYSLTDGEFADHILTLSRDLHRWQANFDFLKAPNGNFSFQFRVSLRDNPDLKLDYEQRSDPSAGDRRPVFQDGF